MALHRWRHSGKPVAHPPHQQRVHRLYTPTMDGFERFLREMVGLDGGIPEGSQRIAKRNRARRKKK
jgi:hypothetical protein